MQQHRAVQGLVLHLGQLPVPLCSLLIEACVVVMPADQGPVKAGTLQGASHRLASKELPSYRSQNQTKLQVGKESRKVGKRAEGSQNKRMLKFVITYLISSNNDSNHNSLPISFPRVAAVVETAM